MISWHKTHNSNVGVVGDVSGDGWGEDDGDDDEEEDTAQKSFTFIGISWYSYCAEAFSS